MKMTNMNALVGRCGTILSLMLATAGVAYADVPNDDCASAQVVSDGAPAFEGDNAAASATDDGEAGCRASDYDVWFEYVATCTGAVTVDTFDSGQEDTVLSAYDACGGNEIACNDDTGGTLSQVSFAVTSGQSYWIRLASLGLPGDYDLNITCTSVPGNDSCATATFVSDGIPAAEGDNSGASATDDAEASCRASDDDVWFEYVATCTGAVTVDTFGSGQLDTVLSAYDACGGAEIACNDDTGGLYSQVSFAVTTGQSYWIRLASLGPPGDYVLNISCNGVPGNDSCATATLVSDGTPAVEGDNSGASATDDAEAGCRASDNDVWFEYVAACPGTATVDTLGSGQEDTVLSVYDACGGNEIACNDDTGGLLSLVTFATTQGQSYWIRLATIGAAGDYDLNISSPDSDGDGVPDGCDVCPGFDDTLDADGDGVPDGCDQCLGDDASSDTDSDGVCDDIDICPGFDDSVDTDGDGVPDGCDICPRL